MPLAPTAIDERLQELLAIEQRLEARLREAEATAAKDVAAAQEQLARAKQATLGSIEGQLADEARADRAAHAAALETLQRDHAARLARLQLTDELLERLARTALERTLSGGDR